LGLRICSWGSSVVNGVVDLFFDFLQARAVEEEVDMLPVLMVGTVFRVKGVVVRFISLSNTSSTILEDMFHEKRSHRLCV